MHGSKHSALYMLIACVCAVHTFSANADRKTKGVYGWNLIAFEASYLGGGGYMMYAYSGFSSSEAVT